MESSFNCASVCTYDPRIAVSIYAEEKLGIMLRDILSVDIKSKYIGI